MGAAGGVDFVEPLVGFYAAFALLVSSLSEPLLSLLRGLLQLLHLLQGVFAAFGTLVKKKETVVEGCRFFLE